MSYTIKRYGQPTITVPDGTINTETSVTLVGKNYAGYGQFLDQNSMTLLQNSAGESPPINPQYGQLWWDVVAKALKVFDGAVFKGLSSSVASPTPPPNPAIGDMWFNTVDESLNVYNGSSWVLIGPSIIKGTGVVSTFIEDVTGLQHAVVEILVGTAVVGIVSKDATFTPLATIPGFSTISPGYNVADDVNGIPQYYNGTATNALRLQGYDPAAFMSSVANTSTVGSITVKSNAGITTGAYDNFSFHNSGNDGVIENNIQGGNILIDLNIGGTMQNVASFYGSNGNVSFSGDISSETIHANVIYSNTIVGGYSNANVTAFLSSPGSSANIVTSAFFVGDGRYLSNISPSNIGPGPGIVRTVSTGVGLTGGPITDTGTISLLKSVPAIAGIGGTIGGVIPDGITINMATNGVISAVASSSYSNANVAAYLPVYGGDILGNTVTANYFVGDGSNLSNINLANVVGAYGDANVIALMSSGNVPTIGVGTPATGAPGDLFVANQLFVLGTSDSKFKSNVAPIQNALDVVCAVGGHEFDWSDEYLNSHGGEDGLFIQKHDYGVVAQDVQAVFPLAVNTREDGSLAIDYQKLSALAFAAIKELNEKVDALTSQINKQ